MPPVYKISGPSPHLSWNELACHDVGNTCYPQEWRATRAVVLADAFEAVRAALGNQPIRILSGYRTPQHNRAIGGARRSQHLQGRALDLAPPAGVPLATMAEIVRYVARVTHPAIRGVGIYEAGGFVHVDVRPGTHLAVWHGRRKSTP